jgi:hypothetical protein
LPQPPIPRLRTNKINMPVAASLRFIPAKLPKKKIASPEPYQARNHQKPLLLDEFYRFNLLCA